jgi:hypothetical protein
VQLEGIEQSTGIGMIVGFLVVVYLLVGTDKAKEFVA